MALNRIQTLLFLAFFAATTPATLPAAALAGDLETADVAYPKDYPEQARQKVQAALQRRDASLAKGFFVNWFTTLQYTGETLALNFMIDDLTKCPKAVVTVQFKKTDTDYDWSVFHDAQSNTFAIHINLNSQRIDLEKLRLPSLKDQTEQQEQPAE